MAVDATELGRKLRPTINKLRTDSLWMMQLFFSVPHGAPSVPVSLTSLDTLIREHVSIIGELESLAQGQGP